MSDSANLLVFGLVIGTVFGLTAAVLLSRLARRVSALGRFFGYDQQARKLASLEKENATLKRRLAEKDHYIRKAMESLAVDATPPDPPEE
ncbi:MAG TPA: hypothetical protein PKW95_04800 [bacterium]|nr:hypothetical protein [bacterium]